MNVTVMSDFLAELVQRAMEAAEKVEAGQLNAMYVAAAGSVLVVPAVIAFLYKKCGRGQPDAKGSILSNIHFYAGSAPNSDNTQMCIQLLRLQPHLVNKPLAEQYYVSHGYTPFLRACWNNNFDLMHYMLYHGADIRLTNADGESPLYLVAYRVSKSTKWDSKGLNLLWNAGCSVDDVNVHNNSMLHLAAKTGNATLVRWLLLHGAEPAIVNSAGFTPRALALRKGSPNHMVVASLLRRPSSDNIRRNFVLHDGGCGMEVTLLRTRSSCQETSPADDDDAKIPMTQ